MSVLPILLLAVGLGALVAFDQVQAGSALAAMTLPVGTALRRPRGRPRKFDEPTRVVTLTLPESVIAGLTRIHADLGRAVAGLVSAEAPVPRRAAELVVFGSRAVISVRPTPSLERRVGVELVPMPDGRALISFDTPHSVAELELNIQDALDDRDLSAEDRLVFEAIHDILRDARRSKDVSLARRNIIVLESANGARRRPTTPPEKD